MKLPPLDVPDEGKLGHNITHFARALRKAGLPIGTGRVLDAVDAVAAAGFTKRQDFFHTLQACFVSRPEHREVFGQVFRLYWRDPQYLEHMMSLLIPQVQGLQEERVAHAAEKRAAQALLDGPEPSEPDRPEEAGETEIEIDASRTISARERLRTLDFEQMSIAEMAEAKRLLAQLRLPVRPQMSRRTSAGLGPLPDWPATLRRANRQAGEMRSIVTRRRRARPTDLVVLCDISGSMSAYSRAVLHFVHAITNQRGPDWGAVHAFTFGTRLTNISRHLRTRDVDAALAAAGAEAQDWEGGTRIGTCLDRFNRDWSRRVLGQGALVVLVTDGLDRDEGDLLCHAMKRLSLSARQIIWINPLMRWDAFAPKARGIRTMLPHVSSFRAGHNIAALEGLVDALGRAQDTGEKARMMAMIKAEAGNQAG